jgi:hypothetical protein
VPEFGAAHAITAPHRIEWQGVEQDAKAAGEIHRPEVATGINCGGPASEEIGPVSPSELTTWAPAANLNSPCEAACATPFCSFTVAPHVDELLPSYL